MSRLLLAPSTLLVALVFGAACRTGVPVVDTGERPPQVDGTIAGHVTGPDGSAPVVGRVVRARSIADGQVYETRTVELGAYTLKVPPGRYRLELELEPGERLLRQPGETEVNSSDLDPDRNFVIADAAVPRP